jgi:hypothetical protein
MRVTSKKKSEREGEREASRSETMSYHEVVQNIS